MAYRFKLKEPLTDGVRRIAVEQLDRAIESADTLDRATWVHETRKTLKRTRALLRLVRNGLGEDIWQGENAGLRSIAEKLSARRDRDILAATVAKLADGSDQRLGEALEWFEALLPHSSGHGPSAGNAAPASASARSESDVTDAVKALKAARHRLGTVEVQGKSPAVLAIGLGRARRSARKALASAEADPSDEHLHELRKTVQVYWRHMRLLQLAWPEHLFLRAQAARELAQTLGEVQDLSVLAHHVDAIAEEGGPSRHAALIVEACRARQARLRAVALPTAARVLALRPKALERELLECWAAAVALARLDRETRAVAAATGPSTDNLRGKRPARSRRS